MGNHKFAQGDKNRGAETMRQEIIAYLKRQMKKKITVMTTDNYHLAIYRTLRFVQTMPSRYNKRKGGFGK
jgi:hypothetical protein